MLGYSPVAAAPVAALWGFEEAPPAASWRPQLRRAAAAVYSLATHHRRRGTAHAWGVGQPALSASAASWSDSQPQSRTAAAPWGDPPDKLRGTRPGWNAAPQRTTFPAALPWGDPPDRHARVSLWHALAAFLGGTAPAITWGDPPARTERGILPWMLATVLPAAGLNAPYGDPPARDQNGILPWGDGIPHRPGLPPGWIWVPPPDPNISPVESVIIPIRRAYIMLHDVQLTRAGVQVSASSLTISLDADSWTWGWSATLLGNEARDAVTPTANGEPAQLEASINGITWSLLAESWSESRAFRKRGLKVAGRGLSAELAVPYELPTSGTTTADLTVQQALAALIPFGSPHSILWAAGTPDWLVPAGAWSWHAKSPIQTIAEAAQSVGLVVSPGRATRTLTVQPRYPVLPWNYATATPDLIVPDAAVLGAERASTIPTQANAVFVHGGMVGGVLGRVYRTGSAGDQVATTEHHDLITHADAARLLGGRILAGHHTPPSVRDVTLPFDGVSLPLAEIGQLMRVELDGTASMGTVSSIAVTAQRDEAGRLSVRQAVGMGEDTPNQWAKFRRLLPGSPLLVGVVTTDHGDGTVTVSLTGGGAMRVRGGGVQGAPVYVRDGQIEGAAPALTAVQIEV